MNRTVTTLAAAAILAATGVAASAAPTAPVRGRMATVATTPCPSEDSVNCYWNARTRGDGTGHSFYAIVVGPRVCTFYWAKAYARTHDRCVAR
ncbi:MAG TPA: hypothetical protein VF642_12475 [Propionibacteriaceae bacterium]|jgi:hypothetical protein